MKQKLSVFWNAFVNSASSPEYYNDILSAKRWFSFTYFVAVIILSVVVSLGQFLVQTVPWVNDFNVPDAVHYIAKIYPDDFELSVVDGEVQINQDYPYVIELPEAFITKDGSDSQPTSLALFTTDDVVFEAVRDSQAYVIVGQTVVYIPDQVSEQGVFVYKAYGIPADQQVETITKEDITNFESSILTHPFVAKRWYVGAFVGIVVIVTGLIFPFIFLARFISAIFFAAVGLIMSLLLARKVSFGGMLNLTFHAFTPLIIIEMLVGMLNSFSFNTLFFLIGYIVWMFLVLRGLKSVETP